MRRNGFLLEYKVMAECITEAMVLDKEESGEYDARVFLYTEAMGGAVAKATSVRKITSKLATHLEPLNFVKVRLIERSTNGSTGYQVGDALLLHRGDAWRKSADTLREALRLTSVFKESGFRGDHDPGLWSALVSMFQQPPRAPIAAYATQLLGTLGFDPRYASCSVCAAQPPTQFSFHALAFFCDHCALVSSEFRRSGRSGELAQAAMIRLC